MNPNKFLVTITDIKDIDIYKKARVTNFLFPLKDFCVGFPNTFSLEQIESGYIYINRILDTKAYQDLKRLLKKIKNNIKGIVFEDFGVITIAKELQLTQQLILYQTHFATNYESINENLNYVDSVVIGTDITKEEIDEILKHTKKPLVYVLYSLIPAMYSRRTLLSNFTEEFNIEPTNNLDLEEQISKKKFQAVENDFGTILYHDKYLNAICHSVDDDKILFYFINPLFKSKEEKISLIEDLTKRNQKESIDEDMGFLNTKTVYRLKGDTNE